MYDRIDSVVHTERRGKQTALTPDYSPSPHYQASHISIRQELFDAPSGATRPRANTLHLTNGTQQASKHKIRVGRGRLPEDFFTKLDLLRINTVQSSLKRKGEYTSMQTPTFASRAQKIKQKCKLFGQSNEASSQQLIYNDTKEPVTKKTANFFRSGGDTTVLDQNSWQTKVLEKKLRDKLAVQQVQSSRTSGREPPNSRALLLQAESMASMVRKDDSCSTAANEPRNHISDQSERLRRKDEQKRITNLTDGPLIFDTTVLRKDLPYKRKFKQSSQLREELFEVPPLRFPQSDKSQETVLRSLKSSILPPLK